MLAFLRCRDFAVDFLACSSLKVALLSAVLLATDFEGFSASSVADLRLSAKKNLLGSLETLSRVTAVIRPPLFFL